MQVRNAQYNARGTIDCEINHPVYGWIPFTADPDDPENLGRTVYQEAVSGALGPVAAYVPPSAEAVIQRQRGEAVLLRVDFMLRLDELGYLEQAEQVAAAAETPSRIKIRWKESSKFHRTDADLVAMAKQHMGMTDEDIDAVFGITLGGG